MGFLRGLGAGFRKALEVGLVPILLVLSFIYYLLDQISRLKADAARTKAENEIVKTLEERDRAKETTAVTRAEYERLLEEYRRNSNN